MKTKEEVLNPEDFSLQEVGRVEGTLDALNWVLNRGDELGSIFRTNIEAFRHAVNEATPSDATPAPAPALRAE